MGLEPITPPLQDSSTPVLMRRLSATKPMRLFQQPASEANEQQIGYSAKFNFRGGRTNKIKKADSNTAMTKTTNDVM